MRSGRECCNRTSIPSLSFPLPTSTPFSLPFYKVIPILSLSLYTLLLLLLSVVNTECFITIVIRIEIYTYNL